MTVNWAMRVRETWSRTRGSGGRRFWIPAVAATAVVLAGACAAMAGTPAKAVVLAGAKTATGPGKAVVIAGAKRATGTTAAAAGTPAATAGATWGRAVEVPGLAALNAGGNAQVLSVSCWRAGYCRAGGFYTRRLGFRQAFVVSERNGRWGKAVELPGSAALNAGGNAEVLSVSCVAGGDCAAGGFYTDHGKDTQGFVVTERGGRWATAREVPGLATLNTRENDAQVSSVSCAPGGYCAAGGYFDGVVACQQCGGGPFVQSSEGFVVTERGGRWGAAQVPPGLAALNAGQSAAVTSVSCPSAGNCAAGGFYQPDVADPDGSPVDAFVVSHANGRWDKAEEVPGSAALNDGLDAAVLSVSCSSAGDCGAGGYLQPTEDMNCDIATARISDGPPVGPGPPPLNCAGSFVVNAKNGHWGTAQYVRNPGMSQVSSVSCSSAGDCSAGGFSLIFINDQAYVVTERGGRWGRPEQVPGIDRLLRSIGADRSQVISVSCWSPGNCGADGQYWSDSNGHGQLFVVSERNGRWDTAEEVPGTAALNLGKIDQVTSVSCTRPHTCAAVGYYTDRSDHTQAFVGGEAK